MKQLLKENFKKGLISKAEFIDAMYKEHQSLFDYSEMLSDTDIASIEIKDEGILFTSRQDGVKLFCKKNDKRTAPFEILNFNEYESEDAGLLYKIISDGDVIFDIGANIGWYSIGFSKKYSSSAIHSFEPLPATFKAFQDNVKLNNAQNIITNNFGFSSEAKILQFYTSPHTSVSNSAENITGDNEVTITDCVVKTLDSYAFDQQQKVDVIKCDVEGAELFVFQGGLKTLEIYKPIIFTEMLRKWSAKFNYQPNDIIALLKQQGYVCFYNNGNDKLVKLEQVTVETTNTNFFFLHPAKHAAIISTYEP